MKYTRKSIVMLIAAIAVLAMGYTFWRTQIVSPVFVFESSTGEPAEVILNGRSYGAAPVTLSYDAIAALLEEHAGLSVHPENGGFGCSASDPFSEHGWEFTRIWMGDGEQPVQMIVGSVFSDTQKHAGALRVEVIGADGTHKKVNGVHGTTGPGVPGQWFMF